MPRGSKHHDDPHSKDDSESDYSTDSEPDYASCSRAFCDAALQNGNSPLDAGAIDAVFKDQRGVCRVSGLPFGEGSTYAPCAVKRVGAKEWSEDNCMLVLNSIEQMRGAAGMPWREFTRWLQVIGKDADL